MTDDRPSSGPRAQSVMQVEVSDYRSLSPLAVVALVLGILSASVFVSPLFLAVAAAAMQYRWPATAFELCYGSYDTKVDCGQCRALPAGVSGLP